MRLRIDTSGVKFRVAGPARPRMESRQRQVQRTTRDGRPIWVVRLMAIDSGAGQDGSTEAIWVEVAGPQPVLALDELAAVQGLVFAPWINQKGEMVRAFRADSIAQDGARRAA
jgi:hypothetical protein